MIAVIVKAEIDRGAIQEIAGIVSRSGKVRAVHKRVAGTVARLAHGIAEIEHIVRSHSGYTIRLFPCSA
jgi:hypothetical protein